MKDGHAITDNEVIRLAFKQKFDARSARLRVIAEWLLVRSPSSFSFRDKLPPQLCSDIRSSPIRLYLTCSICQGHPLVTSHIHPV